MMKTVLVILHCENSTASSVSYMYVNYV